MNAFSTRKCPRPVRYKDDSFNVRSGVAIERNGNLTLIEDDETGEVDWKSPFEIEE